MARYLALRNEVMYGKNLSRHNIISLTVQEAEAAVMIN